MNQEKVIQILKFYRDAENQVKMNNRVIKNLEECYYHGVSSPRLDGLPKSKGRKANPTEGLALNVPLSVAKTICQMKRDNEKIEKVKAAILKEINRLSYQQKEIVYSFYIQQEKWERIAFRINYSVRQCKNIRNKALNQLGIYFTNNQVISNYRFQ